MSDSTQTDLQVPDLDWEHYDTGGKLIAPPQAKDENGKYIPYHVLVPQSIPDSAFSNTQEGFLKVTLDPLTISGGEANGYEVRFQTLSAKPYTNRKTGEQMNASQIGNFFYAAQVAGMSPRGVDGYKQAVRAAGGRAVPVILEWEIYDKQTRQTVRAKYDDFDGPVGQKVPVITTGDGRTLVARAKVKNFITR